ncbi:Signal transduction histidine kinase [Halanaeroarchaeum sp. HSR-CO]|uniref:PAS domain-containing protein n=1 Tax=Halanaeroarchaeum sp. HSR-CO TaxID=2866382 RepID=UPI00217F11A3|nr:PAS domain S-box protein [Halanaeroarchaeum sp. HSR-CO]UWG49058.1 Signal transduction histidine kinase [Halanaeroarchaeum sp. HSR-CO]
MSDLTPRQTHLAQAQQIADIGSWSFDFEREQLEWSEECYRIFGMDPEETVTMDRFMGFVHPDDEPYVREQWESALEGAEYDIEHRIRVDGAVRWVRERAELTVAEDGTPLEAIGVVQDITDRKRREQRLEETKTRYRSLLRAAPDPVFVADAETGEIVEANEAAADLRDQPREEILGLHQSDLHPDGESERYRRLFERHVEEGGVLSKLADGEQVYAVTGDGETVPVSISVETVELPQGQVVYGIFRDVSERTTREKELSTFRQAVESAGHPILFTDRDGTIEYVNPAFEETTGYSAEMAVGRTPRLLKSGEMDDGFYEELWETILSGEVFEGEVVNRRADGEFIHVDQTIAPVEDDSGEIERFVAVNSNITDLKRRQEQLEEQRDRARDLRQRLSVLNRIMRHDLRSSVNIIKGNAGLASARHDLEMLETIQNQADEILEIAENARLIEESLATTEDANTVQEVTALLQTKIAKLRREHPSVSIDSTLPEALPVSAHHRLDAALEQILRNAVEHNDADRPVVQVHLRSPGTDRVEIVIADNGPGIPDGEIEPLNAEIEHALRHTSGLGLWIAYWLVHESGGDISFGENDPRGTTVTIRLPHAQQAAQNR